MPLEEYNAKRDFTHTPEPTGGGGNGSGGAALSFVVQKHHASSLHYDFRLELDSVLLSWAVPKGPSLDTRDKRLAIRVEDHPLSYGTFEGTIPEGEYGGGNVIVWDRGTWEPLGDPHAGLAKGDFKFTLAGEKLRGVWVLVRLKPRPNERQESWLLIKERDDFARPREAGDILAERPESVVSGLSVDGLGRRDPPAPASAAPASAALASPTAPPPTAVDLELATLVERPPEGDEWLAEVKYDGYRVAIVLDGGHARVFTRSHADWTDRFAPLAHAVEMLPATSAVIDGEAVVFDDRGISRFGLLQNALGAHPEKISFAAFDLLHLNGHDLRDMPLLDRKELLCALLCDRPAGSPLRYADHVIGGAPEFFREGCRADLEGTVYKRATSHYLPGRGRDWLKVKCRQVQEFVIGGFTEGAGSRVGLGSLLLGVYEHDRLVYAGRVGTGFNAAALADLRDRLDALETPSSAFDPPPHITGHTLHWVRPTLVAQVAFREWTADNVLRHPVYLGLREDKTAGDVVREASAAKRGPTTESSLPDRARPRAVLGVPISNPDKRLFPDSDFPKLALAEYYAAVAPLMLPLVANRPLTLVRCPHGGGAGCFYQRHPDAGLPHSIHVLPHALGSTREMLEWLTVDSAEGLVALAQMGAVEVHTWLSHADTPAHPDLLVFDLDPGPDLTRAQIRAAALLVREECASLGFTPYLKSTGGKGLHVVMPIKPVWDFTRVRTLAKAFAERLAGQHPDTITSRMAKDLRGGRVFLDYLRNAEGASAVAPYSTRNRLGPTCAVPLAWDELTGELDTSLFTPARVLARVAAGTNPWATIAENPASESVLHAAENALGL